MSMKRIIFYLKSHHYLPVYRKDILEYAYENHENYIGLCYLFKRSIEKFNCDSSYGKCDPSFLFNAFSIKNAKQFGAVDKGYWWPMWNWSTGRLDFLKWMMDYYENDKEDLRNKIWNNCTYGTITYIDR